jgi:hypothetical protein
VLVLVFVFTQLVAVGVRCDGTDDVAHTSQRRGSVSRRVAVLRGATKAGHVRVGRGRGGGGGRVFAEIDGAAESDSDGGGEGGYLFDINTGCFVIWHGDSD